MALDLVKNLKWDRQTVGRFQFSPDGKLLAATSFDWFGTGRPGVIRVWAVETGEKLVDFDVPGASLMSIDFSPNSRSLFSGSLEGVVRIHDLRSFKTEQFSYARGQELRLSPDGTILALSAGQTVCLVDLTTKRTIVTKHLQGAQDVVPCPMAFSPTQELIAAARKDREARTVYEVGIHDLQKLTLVSKLQDDSAFVTALSWSPNGALVATGSDDGTVVLWDVSAVTKKAKTSVAQKQEDKRIYEVAFSRDGKLLAAGGTGLAKIFTVDPFQEIASFEGKGVFFVAFSPTRDLVLMSHLIAREQHDTNLWRIKNSK